MILTIKFKTEDTEKNDALVRKMLKALDVFELAQIEECDLNG